MRVSIWQQFSSNHSSSFTVIGAFSTADVAHSALLELINILTAIEQWREIPENAKSLDDPAPTPPEIEFSKQYDIDWGSYSIDWLGQSEYIDERVKQVQQYVFVSVEFETSNQPTPVVNLIVKMGGATEVEYTDPSHIAVHLRCVAPDDIAAQETYAIIYQYLHRTIRAMEIPWAVEAVGDIPGAFTAYGEIRVNGSEISMELEFSKLGVGLPALFNYLVQHSIDNIEVSFKKAE